MQPHSAPSTRPARGGFTIIELLIVISIIAVLLTITLQVVGAFITAARESATQTTIRKIQGLLSERAEAMHRIQRDITRQPQYTSLKTQYSTQINDNLMKVIAKKKMAYDAFPQSSSEVSTSPANSMSNPELLYYFLTQADVLGSTPVGTDAFSSAEVGDTDSSGNSEFLDGWGRPLRFYRWPTRLFRPDGYWNPSGTAVNPIDATNAKILLSTLPSFSGNLQNDLGRDPDDPLRLCAAFNASTGSPPFKVDFEKFGVGYNTPGTYHVMLVISAGADGVFGMYDPSDTTNNGHLGAVKDANALADDITYLNVRAGGR